MYSKQKKKKRANTNRTNTQINTEANKSYFWFEKHGLGYFRRIKSTGLYEVSFYWAARRLGMWVENINVSLAFGFKKNDSSVDGIP